MSRTLPSRTLTVYHYEASFIDTNITVTLEQSIRSGIEKLSTVGERIERGKDMLCQQTLNDLYDFGDSGFGISIIEFEVDGAAQFVPNFAQKKIVECDAFEFTDGKSLVSRDCMLFVTGNKIAVCGCNNGKGMFASYLSKFLRRANIFNNWPDLKITPISDVNVHARIVSKGVKSVAVTHSNALSEINYALRAQGYTENSISAFFQAMALEKQETDEDARLWLTFNKGKKQESKLDDQMTRYALELINDEHSDLDDFRIFIRGESTPIKGSEINKKSEIEVTKLGHSVKASDAWRQLREVV